MSNSTTHPDAISAIVGGYHGDPFSILGPHAIEEGTAVRAFLPHAITPPTLILANGTEQAMHKTDAEGFYEAIIDQSVTDLYSYRYATYGDVPREYYDPYRFPPQIGELDEHLMGEGTHLRIYDILGAHIRQLDGIQGTHFAVWAPNAERVSLVGNFNQWDGRRHPMRFRHNSGIWEIFIPGLGEGEIYKYEIKTAYQGYMVDKSDPMGFLMEMRPKNASVVWDIDKYQWNDSNWMDNRAEKNNLQNPMSVYELHLGSWRRKNGWEWLTYEDLIVDLIPYIKKMGYTHIELLPVSEHPFDGSWGYQVTGYFAPTSRFGTPEGFMAFVDACHQADIGVILDWVPAHFPKDANGLSFFDGTHLYEHADPLQGEHPDWGTLIFNYERNEVQQFLISNALFWLEKYHIDGLRVDAVASMLYLDFSRSPGQWRPNQYGGRENIGAINFLRRFNDMVHEQFPTVLTMAEESTSWGGVTHPTSEGGLGFDMKWNMGWMHDTLEYISTDPLYRSYHQGTLTFSLIYAFSEKFILPFSHDEVVHLKKSMVDKMPGDLWQKFANLRLLYGYQWSHPGKKLLFMGCEFGQWHEWTEERSLDWHLLDEGPHHRGVQTLMQDLNHLYRTEAALHTDDFSWKGFTWIDLRDAQRSILAYSRQVPDSDERIFVVCNFTPVVRHNYALGVPEAGGYVEILNSDATKYGGSGIVNRGILASEPNAWHEQNNSVRITLPPLGIIFLKKAQ